MSQQDPTFWENVKHAIHEVWRKLTPYIGGFFRALGRFWKRFQITRWLILLFLIAFFAMSAFFTFKAKTADVSNLKASLQATTTVYDQNGEKAGSLYSQKGTFVSNRKISQSIKDAVVSTEDKRFYSHHGFDVIGLARAAVSLVVNRGNITGGGSTITQQLAKNTYLTQKQSYLRKAEELFLAVQIENKYSKDDILSMYLNNAYFGNGVWGVEDAAKRYFGKSASELDASEGATLAAMLRNPSYYNPIDHMDHAVSRRNLVLQLMQSNGKLTQNQMTVSQNEKLVLKNTYKQYDGYNYPSYFDAVIDEAVNEFGISEDDILNKGYKIYTTLNQSYQKGMEAAYENNWVFPKNASDGTIVQSGSISIDPKTGGVVALVGNRGTHVFRGMNYATQGKRQPGSTMKPLAVYTPALEAGYSYDSEIEDKKQTFGTNNYAPTNYNDQYLGEVPMYEALAQSMNLPAVWLLNKIGVSKGVNSVERFGINVPKDDQNLALALGGTTTVSPYQMAVAYTAFANGGRLAEGHFITSIVDATGAVLVDNTSHSGKQIISAKVANEMTSMLQGVFNSGTGMTAKPDGYDVAGKTGSTEVPSSYGYGTKDQWIVGYTPDIVTATWIGFDQTDASHFLEGISEEGVAPIFKLEMENILPNTAKTKFSTEDAETMAKAEAKKSTTSSNWWKDIQSGFTDSFDSLKDSAGSWISGIKGLFD